MTQQIRIGKVLLTKGGKWNAETLYPQLTFVIHNNDGWWSAHANIGSEPSADNHNWVQATDVNSLLSQIKQSEGELSDLLKTATADEQIRIEAEIARVTAENGRAEAEAARAIAESSRVTAEVSRAKAEDERIKAEDKRVGAEDKREHDFNAALATLGSERDLVLNAANNANAKADDAKVAADNANDKATLAQEAANNANNKAALAQEAADNANDKAALVQEAADNANEKATLAQTAANNANEKATLAQSAANNANEKAELAQTAANNANEKATLAQSAANNANEKATLAQEAAALANEKAGIVQEAVDKVNTFEGRLAETEILTSSHDHDIDAIIETRLGAPDYNALPLLCGQPPILFGAGTPQEAIVPINWRQFDPETGEGYNWNGLPSAIVQQYINTSVDTGGRYIAIPGANGALAWKNM